MTGNSEGQGLESRPKGHQLVSATSSVPTTSGGYGGAYPPIDYKTTGFVAKLLEFWWILGKRKWIILSVLLAFLAIGALLTLMTTPLYTSTVRLQIDRNVAKVVEGGNVTPVEGADLEFLKTQYELLQSRQMLERIASTLRLGENKDFLKADQFSIIGGLKSLFASSDGREPTKSDREIAAVEKLTLNRTVRPLPGSRLVDISYSDEVPHRAQQVTTAFADAFMAFNI